MDRGVAEGVVGLVEAELWFPRRRVFERATQSLVDFGAGKIVLLWPVLVPCSIAAGAFRGADALRMRAVRSRQLSQLEALIAQLEAIEAGKQRSSDLSSYRGGAASDALAAAFPGVVELVSGAAPVRFVQYRISTDRDWPSEHFIHGLCLASLDPAALLAHVWAERDEPWIASLVQRLGECLARCVSHPILLERWSWKLGVRESLVA